VELHVPVFCLTADDVLIRALAAPWSRRADPPDRLQKAAEDGGDRLACRVVVVHKPREHPKLVDDPAFSRKLRHDGGLVHRF